jgi:PIN domain nuclease of toxin-antitoxin system
MNYLIDTHILLWYIVGDKRIENDTQTKIESESNAIFLSNASPMGNCNKSQYR